VAWAFAAIVWGVLILTDWLFLSDGAFTYEPNFQHWQRLNDPKY
jgi:hypothetical protein